MRCAQTFDEVYDLFEHKQASEVGRRRKIRAMAQFFSQNLKSEGYTDYQRINETAAAKCCSQPEAMGSVRDRQLQFYLNSCFLIQVLVCIHDVFITIYHMPFSSCQPSCCEQSFNAYGTTGMNSTCTNANLCT